MPVTAVQIPVDDLRVGMYIVRTEQSADPELHIYDTPGILSTKHEIAIIKKEGYTSAFYDPNFSLFLGSRKLPPEQKISKNTYVPAFRDELNRQEARYEHIVISIEAIFKKVCVDTFSYAEASKNIQRIQDSMDTNDGAFLSLTKSKRYDEYTFAHCVNVAIYAVAFGRYLALDKKLVHLLGLAGLFHDIGKMRIPKSIVTAPRRLSKDEFTIMKKHPAYSYDILQENKEICTEILYGVLDHHEKINGEGYPNKKTGDEISLFGKILTVCDIYDAITSLRPYKKPLTPAQTLSIMYSMGKSAFDEELLGHFIKMIGMYPIGSVVRLSTGETAIVVQPNHSTINRPTVLVCFDAFKKRLEKTKIVDLSEYPNISILDCVQKESIKPSIFSMLLK